VNPTDETIAVWRLKLSSATGTSELDWACLDDAERTRAMRFVRDADRRRFVVAHASLRRILGERLGTDPRRLAFERGAFGKPALVGSGLQFNSSHSGDWVLHAVSAVGPVGIDVEAVGTHGDDTALLARVLAPDEQAALRRLPPTRRDAAFTDVWCRKEAYLKGLGEGLLRRPLADIGVGTRDDGARLLFDRASVDAMVSWVLHTIDVGAGHAACLAYRGPAREVTLHGDTP
jgi:4'-phosphopantetheinyl transferase